MPNTVIPVSYTHLDVYKRQAYSTREEGRSRGVRKEVNWKSGDYVGVGMLGLDCL